jgi:hypothetical protein
VRIAAVISSPHWGVIDVAAEPSRHLTAPDTPTDPDVLDASQSDLPRDQGRKESAICSGLVA